MTVQVFKNILVIGDSGVGKTNLVNRLINDKFEPEYVASTGVTTHVIGNCKITVFPGRYRYRFDKMIYDNEEYNIIYDRIIIVCDMNSTLSFNNKYYWLKQIRGLCHKNTKIVACMNKCDELNWRRLIPEEEAKRIFSKYSVREGMFTKDMLAIFDYSYYVSAKTNLNIDKILGDDEIKVENPTESVVMLNKADRDRIYGNTSE